jgi:hypothetical protein
MCQQRKSPLYSINPVGKRDQPPMAANPASLLHAKAELGLSSTARSTISVALSKSPEQ